MGYSARAGHFFFFFFKPHFPPPPPPLSVPVLSCRGSSAHAGQFSEEELQHRHASLGARERCGGAPNSRTNGTGTMERRRPRRRNSPSDGMRLYTTFFALCGLSCESPPPPYSLLTATFWATSRSHALRLRSCFRTLKQTGQSH